MRRLLLVRHAPTRATRALTFPADEAIDERGRAAAVALRAAVPVRLEVLCSPALCCRETVEAAGLSQPTVVPELADCDVGSWAGRALADVSAEAPASVKAWMSDPAACPHAGETLRDFTARVGRWLDGQAQLERGAVVVTHAGVIKAALVHALRMPFDAFWRIDAAPLAITELHAGDNRWTVTRVNCATRR